MERTNKNKKSIFIDYKIKTSENNVLKTKDQSRENISKQVPCLGSKSRLNLTHFSINHDRLCSDKT